MKMIWPAVRVVCTRICLFVSFPALQNNVHFPDQVALQMMQFLVLATRKGCPFGRLRVRRGFVIRIDVEVAWSCICQALRPVDDDVNTPNLL